MTNNLDTYLNLCTEFYDLDKPNAPEDEFNFYLNYIKNAGGKILEPMCGTGRFLVPYRQLGYDIEGFDASDAMLTKCHEKLADRRGISKCFLHDFRSEHKYNLIFIPSGSMSLIIDVEQVKQSLKVIYQHINEGGKFVFAVESSETCNGNSNKWTGKVHPYNEHKYIILSTLACPTVNHISSIICKYELVENNKIIQTEIENFMLLLYSFEEIKVLLEQAGFKNIKQVGSIPDLITIECLK